jgi:hypothetical protein
MRVLLAGEPRSIMEPCDAAKRDVEGSTENAWSNQAPGGTGRPMALSWAM